ncbi:DUF2892 domain-containing protein [Nostocoides sp. F2B08]|uniref:YgaP family membrane protein n=1 Tax=Nostocoides sp. F2B08 TaxID=2653936 RepID=UPI001263B6F6|nr:DUF2892 domain-containing protein [Tetrasphaera sp. F2B08]
MNRNVGTVDRAARAVLGVAALVWALVTGVTSGLGLVLLVLAVVLLATATVGFCPLYRLLGISTSGARRRSREPVAGRAPSLPWPAWTSRISGTAWSPRCRGCCAMPGL